MDVYIMLFSDLKIKVCLRILPYNYEYQKQIEFNVHKGEVQ